MIEVWTMRQDKNTLPDQLKATQPYPHSPIRYRAAWHKYMYALFVFNFLILGWLGTQPPSDVGGRVSQIGTLFYFGFFILMPWWSRIGEPKPVPSRVTFVAH